MDKLTVTIGGISEESSGTVWQVLLRSRIGSRRQKLGPFLRALWKKKHSQHEAVARFSVFLTGIREGEWGAGSVAISNLWMCWGLQISASARESRCSQ